MDAEAINAVIIQLSPDGHGDIKYAHGVIRKGRRVDGGVWTDTTLCLLVNVGNHNRIIIRTTTRGDESPGHIIHLINVENR